MEENPNLWNTKAADLTVGDIVKVNLLAPVVTIGVMAGVFAVTAVVTSVANKVREVKKNRQNKTEK